MSADRARSSRVLRHVIAFLCLAVSVLAAVVLFRDINTLPEPTGDEWFVLSRYERLVQYDDFSDVAMFDEFANNGEHSKEHFPLRTPLRFGLHKLFGSGASASRPISAAEMVVLSAMVGVLVRRRGAPMSVALLSPCMILSFFPVFVFARSVRWEQDIFFFGVLGLLVPLLWKRPRRPWVPALVSGLCCGLAVSMHPMGVIFPIAMLVPNVVALRRPGKSEVWRTTVPWMAGVALPVLVTALYYASDWQNTLIFFERSRDFYRSFGPVRLRAMLSIDQSPSWLPDQLRAALNSIRWGFLPLPTEGFGRALTKVVSALWGLCLAAVTAGAVALVVRRLPLFRRTPPPDDRWSDVVVVWSSATLAALAVTAVALPNTDYSLYFNGIAWISAYLGIAWLISVTKEARIQLLTFLIVIVVAGAGLARTALAVLDDGQPISASAPLNIHAMSEMASVLGVGKHRNEPMYADLKSWAGAGKHLAPTTEYLVFELVGLRRSYEGVVLSGSFYSESVEETPPYTRDSSSLARRRQLMASITEPLSFAGALITERRNGDALDAVIWLVRRPIPPVFGVLDGRARLTIGRGKPVREDRFHVSPGAFDVNRGLGLPPGRYAAMITGDSIADSQMIVEHGGDSRIESSFSLENFPHRVAGAVTIFEVEERETAIRARGRSTRAGTAQITYWRLGLLTRSDRASR